MYVQWTKFIIVFSENSGSVDKLLEAIKIDYTGSPIWSPSTITFSSITSPKLKVSEGSFHNNQVVVVWEDQRIDEGVYAQNIYSDGTIGPLGIPAMTKSTSLFNLYPNPSLQFPILKINSVLSENIILQISDAAGKILITKNISLHSPDTVIDLKSILNQNLAAGIYTVEIKDENNSMVERWVKE